MTDRYEMLKPLIAPLIRVVGIASVLYQARKAGRRRPHVRPDAEAVPRIVAEAAEVAALRLPGFWFDARLDRHERSFTFRGAVGMTRPP